MKAGSCLPSYVTGLAAVARARLGSCRSTDYSAVVRNEAANEGSRQNEDEAMASKGVYTASEVGELLRMPVTEVYRAAKAGDIPGRIKVGGRTRFSAAVIDAFISGLPTHHRG